MTVLIIILFVISIAILVSGAIVLITAEEDLYSLRCGTLYFVVSAIAYIIGMLACWYLCLNVIGDSTTDVPSTEEHVALSDGSIPATSEKLHQVVSIYDVDGNLIEQYVDEYE